MLLLGEAVVKEYNLAHPESVPDVRALVQRRKKVIKLESYKVKGVAG